MATSYAPLDGGNPLGIQRQNSGENKRYCAAYFCKAHSPNAYNACTINTTLRNAFYSSALLLIIIAYVTFWVASRQEPLLFSLHATQTVENNAKALTFVWTLIGTILAFGTSTLFNQLLKLSVQRKVAEQGLKIGLIEFWSRLHSRKWLHDTQHGRFALSAFSVIFAIATGLLVSAHTGLITSAKIYLQAPLAASELDISTEGFWTWFESNGTNVLDNCSATRTYGKGKNAITLAMCPQVKEPLPYVMAGLASIETEHAEYDPTTSVAGMRFNGTTKGVLPHGWNSVPYFNSIPHSLQPPVEYNYSMIQQGVSVNVSCARLGLKSNITWHQQGEYIFTVSNGVSEEDVYLQNMTFGPNKAVGIVRDQNEYVSGASFIAIFESFMNNDPDKP